jgi:transcriptional regulator with XRE-family HTH domain
LLLALPYNKEKRKENLTVWLEKLNHLKKLSGMTIEQISAASCVPKGTLNKLFSGQTKDPQLSTVSAVVHCMGYTLDDLSDNTVNGKVALTPQQSALLSSFDLLNEEGQQKALEYVEDLVLAGRYKKDAALGVAAKDA